MTILYFSLGINALLLVYGMNFFSKQKAKKEVEEYKRRVKRLREGGEWDE